MAGLLHQSGVISWVVRRSIEKRVWSIGELSVAARTKMALRGYSRGDGAETYQGFPVGISVD